MTWQIEGEPDTGVLVTGKEEENQLHSENQFFLEAESSRAGISVEISEFLSPHLQPEVTGAWEKVWRMGAGCFALFCFCFNFKNNKKKIEWKSWLSSQHHQRL